MKKFEVKSLLVMLLALAMVLSLAACGRGGKDTTAPVGDDTEPNVTGPIETDPPETDPPATDPVETDPVETDPPETDPPKYDPIETDPVVTDPVVTDPVETDPAETEPEETLAPSAGGEHTHIYTMQIMMPATCESEGEQAMICSICGDEKEREIIPANGHSYSHVEMDVATLTHHAAIVDYCAECKSIAKIVSFTKAHNFETTVVPDIKTAAGFTAYGCEIFKCKDCGYTLTVGSNASDGHYYTPDEGSGKMVCSCGKHADATTTYNDNPNAGPQIFPQG